LTPRIPNLFTSSFAGLAAPPGKLSPQSEAEALDRQMQPFYVRLEQAKEYQLWQPSLLGEEPAS
jgi:hypothetical protein